MTKKAIVWIREDFRTEYNEALATATQNHEFVSALYIYNPKNFDKKREAQKWWISKALENFNVDLKKLNITLEVQLGDELEVLSILKKKDDVTVYWSKVYEPDVINKGKKISDYLDKEVIEKIQKTTFKKGNLPHNTLSDGAVTLRRDKTGISYYYYRISKAKWMPYHHKLWIDVHGEIPKGYIVVFKDRNTLNCKLENLELITRRENMQRNSIQRYPNEIRQTIKTLTKLKKTINGKEQN